MLFQILLPLFSHIIVPLVFSVSLWRGKYASIIEWLATALAYGAYVLFLFVAGGGWFIVSVYLRPIITLLFLIALVASLRRIYGERLPWWQRPHSIGGWLSLAVNVAIAVFFLWSTAPAVEAFSYDEAQAVELASPFPDGTFYVLHGGNAPVLNYHNVNEAQRFALDIVELNRLGTRASGIYPSDPTRYVIYGQELVSPCNGEIIEVENELPDHNPPDTDTVNVAGNHVVIRCQAEGVDVVLAHMMEGSVLVQRGEQVQTGQPVGLAGNSGNTSEPHLHIHAVRTGYGSVLDGEGVPILINGRFLVRHGLLRP
jgi:hypothetical protein